MVDRRPNGTTQLVHFQGLLTNSEHFSPAFLEQAICLLLVAAPRAKEIGSVQLHGIVEPYMSESTRLQ